MKSIVGIYKITSPSGRVYIGQSWNIKQRWYTYRGSQCKNQPKLDASFSKYGARNHKYEIVHELPHDIEQLYLDETEKVYIEFYRECGTKMMNLRGGGDGGRLSEETRIKIGLKSKGHPPNKTSFKKGHTTIMSDETKKKLSIVNTGKKHTEETKAKLREARIKQGNPPRTAETFAKIGLAHKGRKLSDERKARNSELKKGNKYCLGKFHTEETKDKIRAKKTGVSQTDEHRKNRSEAVKLWWAKRKGLS